MIDVRWDNNDGADKICKQLGYEEGVKGPRYAVSKGSGPIHIVSWAKESEYKDDVINETYKLCTHAKDQAVACKGGLGATPGKQPFLWGPIKIRLNAPTMSNRNWDVTATADIACFQYIATKPQPHFIL